MTQERWEAIQRNGGVVDLSNRAKWLLTGEDRIRYLNGQVTQDVRRGTAEKAVYACVSDVKGRISGDIFVRVTADGEGLLLDAEEGLREALMLRLDRYIVADDVEIQDVTDDWDLVHYFGEAVQGIEGGSLCERFGVAGRDVWTARGESVTSGDGFLSAEELEVLRVLNGVPRYPFELNGEVFPPEAGLELRAIDYNKGCYIGQEVISRIRTSRKMPRELVAWRLNLKTEMAEGESAAVIGPTRLPASRVASSYRCNRSEPESLVEPSTTPSSSLSIPVSRLNGGGEVGAGAQVVLPGEGGRILGGVTSVVVEPETGLAAGLAYVKLGTVPDDSQLLVGNHLATIRRLVPGLFL
jgi:tRNA-modifying protein YgfZ